MIYYVLQLTHYYLAKDFLKLKIFKAYGAGHYISDPGVKDLMKKEIDGLQYLFNKNLFN